MDTSALVAAWGTCRRSRRPSSRAIFRRRLPDHRRERWDAGRCDHRCRLAGHRWSGANGCPCWCCSMGLKAHPPATMRSHSHNSPAHAACVSRSRTSGAAAARSPRTAGLPPVTTPRSTDPERFRQQHPPAAVGVSLGGNALLRWAGEVGSAAGTRCRRSRRSARLDLASGGHAIGRGFNRQVYTRMFLQSMKPGDAQAAAIPGLFDAQGPGAMRATCTSSTTCHPPAWLRRHRRLTGACIRPSRCCPRWSFRPWH